MKFITASALFVLAFVLSGCNEEPNGRDQCLRQEIFKQCMASIPKGPTHITDTNNDWGKVIDNCENAAYHQSLRLKSSIKPECRAY